MRKQSPFFVVWNPAHGAPRVRHDTVYAAMKEADRLAMANPGQEFFVLATASRHAATKPVDVTEYDISDLWMPF